jgi:hypothetical protein
MNKFFSLVLVLLLTTIAFGQEKELFSKDDPKNEIYGLFHSSESKDRAWAAYLIGKHEMREMLPDLYELLASTDPTSDRGDYYIQCAALDSLIQLDAPLPSEMVSGIYQNFPDQTLVLLAKRPAENCPNLFSLLQQNIKSIEWVAICNLLSKIKSPEFATQLLSEVEIEATVRVYDSQIGGANGGFGRGIGTGCGGDGIFSVPEGFPPIAIYKLTERTNFGNVVVAPGRHPIYYERLVVKGGQQKGVGTSSTAIRKDDYIIEYLAELLDTSDEEIKACVKPNFEIILQHIKNYSTEIDSIGKKVEHLYSSLLKRFTEKNIFNQSKALSIKGRLEIRVYDFRNDRTLPLPELPQVKVITF